MIALALAFALLPAIQQAPSAGEGLVVQSQGGLFVARLAKAGGQERVPDELARWKLEVTDTEQRPLWSCFHPGPEDGARYLLSEDGATLAWLSPRWSDARAVVTLRTFGGEPVRVFGGELDLPLEARRAAPVEGAWLADREDAALFAWIPGPFGPQQMLQLECVGGETRTIDLASGRPAGLGGGMVPVRVEPPFEKESVPPSRVPKVRTFSAPERVAGDVPLVVRIFGEHPNPGWRVFAFGLEPAGEDGRTLLLVPRARPPMPGGLRLQQIEPYEAEARVIGLPPGHYRIAVRGHEGLTGVPLPVEVTPGGVLATLRTRGGILGLDETVSLYVNGVVGTRSSRVERDRMAYAPPRSFALARALLSRLPGISPPESGVGADLFDYELRWRAGEQWREVSCDDGSARGELREAIDALRALAAP